MARPGDPGSDDGDTSLSDVSPRAQASSEAEDRIIVHVGILRQRLTIRWILWRQPSVRIELFWVRIKILVMMDGPFATCQHKT